ncbi:MAG: ARMT1-like domain-containing protein [Infirmifilum sp.]
MKVAPECIPCIFNVRAKEILNSNLSDTEKIEAFKVFLEYYATKVSPETTTTLLSWQAFRKVKEILREQDPYASFKKASHEAALKIASFLEREVEGKLGFARFHFIVKASLAANYIDPGTPIGVGPEHLSEKINSLKLGVDETEKLYMKLLQSGKVAFVLDNCGEAVIDRILAEELNRMGIEVRLIVKGDPYQNDITYKEAIEYEFNKVGEVVSTGSDFPGVVPGYVSQEAVDTLNWADIVIAKGMANYEAFRMKLPEKPVFIMLVAKCDVIARSVGVSKGEAAAFFLQGSPSLSKLL